MQRKCPFTLCNEAIPHQMFACRRHWFRLTRTQRAEVHAAFNAYQDGSITLEDLRRRQQAVLDATKIGGQA